jgi:hypothetical protein
VLFRSDLNDIQLIAMSGLQYAARVPNLRQSSKTGREERRAGASADSQAGRLQHYLYTKYRDDGDAQAIPLAVVSDKT